jgi:hypothetical protein
VTGTLRLSLIERHSAAFGDSYEAVEESGVALCFEV